MRVNLKPVIPLLCLCLVGCGVTPLVYHDKKTFSPVTRTHRDLLHLPRPSGAVSAAVYRFRDMTGQYKGAPHSNLSSAVSQGAASLLVKAMKDSHWFLPVEREGLQDVLTERKIIRSVGDGPSVKALPDLMSAAILMEGGIVGYDTNIRTGGLGAKYFGISSHVEYRIDQVTVSLRAVDVRDGRVLESVLVSRKIYAYQLDSGYFRFVSENHLAEAELGFTSNDPVLVALQETIESAVIQLVVDGINHGLWALQVPDDSKSPIIRKYTKRTG